MEDQEYTILKKPQQVCIFELPKIVNSKGHYLDDWKNMVWEGGIKVISKNDLLQVQFINKDNSIYAICPVSQNFQEFQGICSQAFSYYYQNIHYIFARLQNKDKNSWVGVAFRDRNDAYDFNVCFNDFYEKLDREKNPQKYQFKSTQDFSQIKGKIQIKLAQDVGQDNCNWRKQPDLEKKQEQCINQNKFFDFEQFGKNNKDFPKLNQNDFGEFSNFEQNHQQKQNQTQQQQSQQQQNQINLLDL